MNLYHYCSNDAFLSIIQSKVVRLSLLTLSNDSLEGKHIYEVALKKFQKFNRQKELNEIFEKFSDGFLALGFCLSEMADQLSQWRAYAEDGSGVALGFDFEKISAQVERDSFVGNGCNLLKIIYNEDDDFLLPKEVEEEFNEILADKTSLQPPTVLSVLLDTTEYGKILSDYQKRQANLMYLTTAIALQSYSMKPLFFKEENEWRLISYFIKSQDSRVLKYKRSGNKLVPYLDFPSKPLTSTELVEVVLGPKNETPEWIVEKFLKDNGFAETKVRRSGGSYR